MGVWEYGRETAANLSIDSEPHSVTLIFLLRYPPDAGHSGRPH